MLLLAGCEDSTDQPVPSVVSVQFGSSVQNFMEHEGQKSVAILLDKPAPRAATIQVEITGTNQVRFTTDPDVVNNVISLNIASGAQTAEINITPVDNTIREDSVKVGFRLRNLPKGFFIGQRGVTRVNIVDDESTSTRESAASFAQAGATIREKNHEGFEVFVDLSEPLPSAGGIEIVHQSSRAVYGQHFTTDPGMIDGKLNLAPEPGSSRTSFVVRPVDNPLVNGDLEVNFVIAATGGAITKGLQLHHKIVITDDELENMPRGYEVSGGGWMYKRFITYDEKGRVNTVQWESHTPHQRNGTETYSYNDADRLIKKQLYPGIEEVYTWENNRISKVEKVEHGVVKNFNEYEFDDDERLVAYRTHYRQADQSFRVTMINVLLYYADGNLYKHLVYLPQENGAEPVLHSTRTYEGYFAAENPFPMADILPGVTTQRHLHTSYRIEENGVNLMYQLSYTYRADGKVDKRMATGPQGTETAVYHYY